MKEIAFQQMKPEHLALWNKWIEIPHVKDVWFIEGYEPAEYMAKKLDGNGYDYPFIILLYEQPVGFIQSCDLYAYRTLCPKPKGVFTHEEPGTFCFDLFIAEEELLGKGYGTKIVEHFAQMLRDDFKAKKILIDPAVDNRRAIRCYEKAGFTKIGTVHDGITEVVIMEWVPDSKTRTSVRVILVNQNNELLLLKADDPNTTTASGHYNGPFWFLVGGQIERNETIEEAALREIFEEAGIEKHHIELGPIVWKGEFDLMMNGVLTRQKQSFIVAKTNVTEISLNYLTKQEKEVIKDFRWFSYKQIDESDELIYPLCLKKHLPAILAGHYPCKPIIIDVGENPKN